jgi:cytochrome c
VTTAAQAGITLQFMDRGLRHGCLALALAGFVSATVALDFVPTGREVFERRCRTCHGGTPPSNSPVGPSLAGIVGKRPSMEASGIHSRAGTESGIAWDRESLRRFLSDPSRDPRRKVMPVVVSDPRELESLLDYLESLR